MTSILRKTAMSPKRSLNGGVFATDIFIIKSIPMKNRKKFFSSTFFDLNGQKRCVWRFMVKDIKYGANTGARGTV